MSFDTFVSWLKVCGADGKSRGQKPFELSCNWLGIGSGQMCGVEDYFWSDFEKSKQVYLYANIRYDRYIISKPFLYLL